MLVNSAASRDGVRSRVAPFQECDAVAITSIRYKSGCHAACKTVYYTLFQSGRHLMIRSEWTGPVTFDFSIHEHKQAVHSVRYHAPLGNRFFDVYLPWEFIIDPRASQTANQNAPEGISITLEKLIDERNKIRSWVYPARIIDLDLLPMARQPGHSYRYDAKLKTRRFSLYIPNEVFEGKLAPQTIRVKIDFLTT